MKRTTILLIGLFLISSIFAQPGARRNPHNEYQFDRMMMKRGERSENREQMMIYRLTKHLELTTEQAEKFFPKMREHREIMDKMNVEIFETSKVLRDKIKDEKEISDAELKDVLKKVDILHGKKSAERNKFINSMDNILDNTQIVKLALAPQQFKHDKMMKKDKRFGKRR